MGTGQGLWRARYAPFLCRPPCHFCTPRFLFSTAAFCLLSSAVTLLSPSSAFAQTLFGPKQYTLTTSSPQTFSALVSTTAGPGHLHVDNGAADGSARLRDARITLNGSEIVHSEDMGPDVALVDKPITLLSSNVLTITLTGPVSGTLSVTIERRSASLTSVTPNSGRQGVTLTVNVVGSNTHFVQGTTQLFAGPGVSVGGAPPGEFGPVTVQDATHLTATFTIQPTTLLGPRTLLAKTGGERAALFQGFTVLAGTPAIAGTTVTTLAGSGTAGLTDGAGSTAQFRLPFDVAPRPDGSAVVADTGNSKLRQIAANGTVSTVTLPVTLLLPTGVTIDSSGRTVIADTANCVVRIVQSNGTVTTIGSAGSCSFANGTAGTARFKLPRDVVADATGNLFVADTGNFRVRKIDPQGNVTTLAGSGTFGSTDGPATSATFGLLAGIAVASDGSVLVSDAVFHKLRKIASGTVSTLAGTGTAGFADGAATAAQFAFPTGLTRDSVGNLYVADTLNNLIRRLTPQGNVETIAGTGAQGSQDGPGTAATFSFPVGVGLATAAKLFVADTFAHKIRVIGMDSDPPTITASVDRAANAAGWHNSDVTVTFTCADAGSGIATCPPPIVVSTEGAGQVISGTAVDVAGNSASTSVTLNIDRTAPVLISTLTPPANLLGWHSSDVTVTFTATDTLSGVASVSPPVTLTTEGANQIVTGTATDRAGNLATASVTVNIDRTSPSLILTSPLEGAFLPTSPVTVTGTVNEEVTALTVNGIPAVVSAGVFSAIVPLVPGSNTLTFIATDRAGNVGTTIRTVTLDNIPPVVRILAPASGQVLSQTSLTVTGTVDDSTAVVTVNGVTATLSGGIFTAAGLAVSEGLVTLTAAATDPAGNVGTDQVAVTVDTTPPALTLTAPAEVTAGAAVTLQVEASDNLGLLSADILVDGRLVASGSTSPLRASFIIPASRALGDLLTVTARATDRAGLVTTSLATMRVTVVAVGPGFLRGIVLDDTKGLPQAGATVAVSVEGNPPPQIPPQVTGADGQYAFTLDPGTALVQVTKPGSTAIERKVPVRSDLLTPVPDARLTPHDPAVSVLGTPGGTAANQANAIRLTLAQNALPEDTRITLTAVSGQGLLARLPLGWSPLLAADLHGEPLTPRTPEQSNALLPFASPALLTVRLPDAARPLLPPGATVTVAQYDPLARAWVALDPGTVTTDGLAVEVLVRSGGQIVFLRPDPAPHTPPMPLRGQVLAAATPAAIPADATAVGSVTPSAIPPGQTTASGQVTITATAPLPSGTTVQAAVTETYTLISGEQVTPPSFVEEVVLYACEGDRGCGAANTLGAGFPVTPSRSYTLKELLVGTVHVDIRTPEVGGQGTIIGPDGGTVTASDGTLFTILAGALSRETVVAISPLAESELQIALPGGVQFLRALQVDLTRATLSLSAEIAFPLPAGITTETQLLVARVLEVDGILRLQVVGVGQIAGALLTSRGTVSGVSFPGITSGGTYVVLRAVTPVGFVTGVTQDASGAPRGGVVVTSGSGFVDVSRSDGRYLIVAPVGNPTITATDLATGQGATETVTVAAGQAATQPLQVRTIPPAVVSVVPAPGATLVPVSTQITVTFSKPIAPSSVTTGSLVLSGPTGTVETVATLSPLGTVVTLYPTKVLTGQATYTLVVSQAIRDTGGVALPAPFTSQFTTIDTTPPLRPAAGRITTSFPDAGGNVTVRATQGTAEPGNLVVVMNTDSGAVASATVRADGSFETTLFAMLGDELLVVLQDAAGNQTIFSAGAYVHPDGRAIVTSGGGTLDAPGGATLTLDPLAVSVPTTIRLTPLSAADLTVPLESGSQVVSGLKIEADQVFRSAARLTLPIPSGMTVDGSARPFLARPETIAGATVLVMVDSLRVSNGQLTTASPPFPGILTFGDYFAILPPVPFSALVTGTVTTSLPGEKTVPVVGALVRAGTGASTKTGKDGSYALYVYPPSLPLVPQLVSISATEPVTRTTVTASVNMTWSTATIQRYTLNFALPGGEILRDRTPPTLTISLSGPSIQGSTIGFGSEVTVTVRATDDRALNDGTATLTQDGRSLPLRISGPGVYTATFTAGTVLGLSTLVASVKDTSDNQGSTSRKIQFVDPATRPTPVAGPPEVVEVNPGNGAQGVNVFDQILVRFSEPVRNLTEESVRLEKLKDGAPVALIPLTIEPDLLGSTVNLTLTPRANLEFGTPYRLTLTTDIFDLDAEPLGTRLAAEVTTTFTTIPLSLVGTLGAGGNIRAATLLEGGQLVTLDRQAGVQVWDVSDPTAPRALSAPLGLWGGFPVGYLAMALLPEFTYTDKSGLPHTAPVVAVVGYGGLPDQGVFGEFYLVSLESRSAPTIIGKAHLGTHSSAVPQALLLHGNFALVASIGAGLQVVDLLKAVEIQNASPLGPALQGRLFEPLVGGFDFGGLPIPAPVGLVASQKTPSRAFVGERSRGAFEVNLGGLPLLSVSLLRSGSVLRVALAEGVPRGDTTLDLLLLGTMEGLTILNLTDPSLPPVTLPLPFPPFGLTAHGPRGLAFVNGGTAGLLVVDLKNLTPTLLGTATNLGFAAGTVVVDARFAYVAASTFGVQIVRYDPRVIQTKDVVVIAWIDEKAFTLPSGASADLVSGLDSRLVSCELLLIDWSLGTRRGISTDTDIDRQYANIFLLKNSPNSRPGDTIDPAAVEKGGDFRLFNRFKVFFAFGNGKIVGAPSFLQAKALVGKTPTPCSGISAVVDFFIRLGKTQSHSSNGVKKITPSGTGVFQLNEGRLGPTGQAVDRTLNACNELLCDHIPVGPTTPWIWSVIKFDVQGKRAPIDHQIVPSYSVYEDGKLVEQPSFSQSVLETFISFDDTSEKLPEQIR